MNLFKPSSWFQRSTDTGTISRLDQLAGLFGGGVSFAGINVNRKNAIETATVFACIRVISEDCAHLKCNVISVGDDGTRTPLPKHRVARLLNKRPNSEQTALEFRETLIMHAALTGNGFAFKVRNARDEVVELIPLMPDQVSITQDTDMTTRYDVSDARGGIIGRYTERDILHLRGPAWDTYRGLDIVSVARQAIGLAIATERSQSKLHENGGRPSGILSTEQKVDADTIKKLREAFKARFAGANAHGTAVLDAGFKFTAMQMSGVDAQGLETRRLQIEEVCRIFRVFPQMIGHSDKTSTYASAEAFFAAHVRTTLNPWLKRLEKVFDKHLLNNSVDIETMHDTRPLTRASTADREKYYRSMAETGIMTRNEVRAEEGLPPIDGLDQPLTPLNMTTDTSGGAENVETE